MVRERFCDKRIEIVWVKNIAIYRRLRGKILPSHSPFQDEIDFGPISIIGRDQTRHSKRSVQDGNGDHNSRYATIDNSDVFSSGNDADLDLDLPPPPPPGKRKVIHAKKPNNFIGNIKVYLGESLLCLQ